VRKLLKLVMVCKSCRKRFTATFLWTRIYTLFHLCFFS